MPDSAEHSSQATSRTAPQLLLVIDDEEIVRNLIARILERDGYQVLRATDGISGIELFQAQAAAISCVLVDMAMPHLNGAQTIAGLRQVRDSVPVILMSGFDQYVTHEIAGAPPAGFLAKPFSPADLRELVTRVLNDNDPGLQP